MKGSVRFKLITLFIAVGLVPLIVVVSVSYLIYADNLQAITADVARYNAEWAVDNLNKFFQNVENTTTIINSKSANRFLRTEENTPTASWDLLSLFELYETSLFDSISLQNITILGFNGKCISSRDGFYRFESDKIKSLSIVSKILETEKKEPFLCSPGLAEYRPNGAVIETMSLGRKLFESTTLELLGVIILDFYPEEIAKYYKNVRGDIIGQMEIREIAVENNISKKSNRLGFPSFRNGLTINLPLRYENWYLSYSISYEELREPIRYIIRLTFIVLVLSILVIGFVFFFVSKQIIAPLQNLKSHMVQAAGGDFSVRFEPNSDDQVMIGLQNSFNKMVLDLENLIKQKEMEHRNYLQAHLRMLQQQINPHFLYNTLDTIIWMSLENRKDDVVELVEDLSTFFRLNLSKGIDVISIADCMKSLESYLAIQKVRYPDCLNYEFFIDPLLNNGKILKLIVQPIVENALYHGIRENRQGRITVSGELRIENVIFLVSDDGVGIAEDRLMEIREMLKHPGDEPEMGKESEETGGFGLSNVQQRIMLYYGPEYGLSIESEPGIGTTVKVEIPWVV